jgi:hypothetical protein
MTMPSISDVLDDLASLEALGADLHGLHGAAYLGFDADQVGQPGAPGMVFRMGDVISKKGAFTANFTYSRHDWTPDKLVVHTLHKKEGNVKPREPA